MLVTQQYRVEGPVMLFLTTTAIDVDEELVNRCLVLTINESREQTRQNPGAAAIGAHARGARGAERRRIDPPASPKCAAAAAAARGREPLRRGLDVPG